MYTRLYEFEERRKENYDGVREYCLIEHVNAEYLRTVIASKKDCEAKRSRLCGMMLIKDLILK